MMRDMNQVSSFTAAAATPSQRPRRAGRRAAQIGVAAALLLGTAALANQLAAKRAERRNPPQGRFVTVDDIPVHYLEQGAGPTLVLIHGNGVSADDYVLSGLFDRLSQTHRVIAFDRPGFGYTPRPRDRSWAAQDQAELLLHALSAIGVESAVFVAHSWGTLVALEAALAEPERVSALVLMSGYYWPTARLDVPLLSGPAIPGLGDVLRFTVSPLVGRAMTPLVMKQLFAPAEVPERFKEGFSVGMSLRPSQLRATAADTARMVGEAAKSAARRPQITAPVLVISGDGDKIVIFESQSRRLADDTPGAELYVEPGAGHMVHHIAPDEVAAAIEAFVDPTRVPSAAVLEGARPLQVAG
jgi:pimeloyl-ACP methyl ester carboxylesterase